VNIRKYRDLRLIDINKDQILVISCDSAGGIGNKENDIVKTDPEIVGQFTTKVALMEVLAFGAKPITVVDTLSVEMNDTGKKVIKGVRNVLESLSNDLDLDNMITGTTEENFPVSVTGIGITVIGIINKCNWTKPKTYPGLVAAIVGIPNVGNEVLENGDIIIDIKNLMALKEKRYIKEILPVGSKGILYELKEMARTNNIDFKLEENQILDLKKSAGPATCTIISIEENKYKEFKSNFPIPVNKIGKFI